MPAFQIFNFGDDSLKRVEAMVAEAKAPQWVTTLNGSPQRDGCVFVRFSYPFDGKRLPPMCEADLIVVETDFRDFDWFRLILNLVVESIEVGCKIVVLEYRVSSLFQTG